MQRLVAQHGAPAPLPDCIAALICQHQGKALVTKNGVKFDYQKLTYRFWHENSITCSGAAVGKEVRFTWDPEKPEVIYILGDRGEFVEALPAKEKTRWFDAIETSRDRARHLAYQNRIKQGLDQLQAITKRQEAARILSNSEKLRVVQQFPITPQTLSPVARDNRQTGSTDGTVVSERQGASLPIPPDPTNRLSTGDEPLSSFNPERGRDMCISPRSLSSAESVLRAQHDVTERAARHADRERRNQERIQAEPDDFTALADEGRDQAREAAPGYAVSMDELRDLA